MMNRHVDIEKLILELRTYANKKVANGHRDTASGILSAVCYIKNNFQDDAPTADVEKVVQGEWVIEEYEYFTCTNCGYDRWNSCDCTSEAKAKLEAGETPKYCEGCGANMRESSGY